MEKIYKASDILKIYLRKFFRFLDTFDFFTIFQ